MTIIISNPTPSNLEKVYTITCSGCSKTEHYYGAYYAQYALPDVIQDGFRVFENDHMIAVVCSCCLEELGEDNCL